MATRLTAMTPDWLRLWNRLKRWTVSVRESVWTPVIAAAVVLLLVAGGVLVPKWIAASGQRAATEATAVGLQGQADPALTTQFTLAPEAVRPISMDEARVWNAGLPFSTLPILAARPFIMPPENLADYARALDCLTAAVYYEAASETGQGQAAVAQVVLNRMRHPAFPKTVCGVVFQGQERTTGCQFSFTCDGALARIPSVAGWARARAVAAGALNGFVAADVGMATHYHTDWVAPYWAERLVKMRQIGTHIFYRWTGGWGLPGAFNGRHIGEEPVIEKLAALATFVETPPPELVEIPVTELLTPDFLATEVPSVAPEPVVPSAPQIVTATPEVTAAPPAPPPVLTNPLTPAGATAPQRRTRIATPR